MKLKAIGWLAAAAVGCATVLLPATPAVADPDDDSHSIEEELEEAIKDYIEAKDALEAAEDDQKELESDIESGEEAIARLNEDIGDFSQALYLQGGLPQARTILTSKSPDAAMDGLSTVGYLGSDSAARLRELSDAQAGLEADREALAEAVEDAEDALADKKDAKDAAQREVDESAGGPTSGNGSAEPAPRNPDGSWPEESCSVDDPSGTGGCVTPRMNHTYEQVQAAGYDHYAACYRSTEDGGEHPRGRACDFAASADGFGDAASGADKDYGDSLAGWAVDNADSLGIMYVIWYNQFWDPANGWGPYSGGNTGNPSSDHTNHVHISML